MTASNTAPVTYVAITDASIKTWHLSTPDRTNVAFCGTKLMTPGDTRKFAAKWPSDERVYTTDPDVGKVTCGACKRNREYKYATGAATRPAPTTTTASTRSRQARAATAAAAEAGGTALSATAARDMAQAAADRNGGGNTTPSQERAALDARVLDLLGTYAAGRRVPIADLRTAMDPAPTMAKLKASLGRLVKAEKATLASGGYCLAPNPDAAVAAIDAALAGNDAPAADEPGSATDRAETDACERGTPGCSVRHTRDSECATW